jgi:CheY-like chemotaxis protein
VPVDPQHSASILIVDDDPAVLALLRHILRERYTVYTAADGREAVNACLTARKLDLLLVDVMLPGEVGPDVVKRCLKHQSDARVVYMSGFADEVLRVHGVDPGVPFLRKPFLPQDLLEEIARVLAAHQK